MIDEHKMLYITKELLGNIYIHVKKFSRYQGRRYYREYEGDLSSWNLYCIVHEKLANVSGVFTTSIIKS